jgi:predicted nucleic acid-binding protein
LLVVDSNLWIYYADRTTPEHSSVRPYLAAALREEEIGVNTVIQVEVAHYLVKRLGRARGEEAVKPFLQLGLRVEPLDEGLVRDSLSQLLEYSDVGIGGRDATVLATLRRLETRRLATHDQAFRRVNWVEVEDPLE